MGDRLIGYCVEKAVYGPPLPAHEDLPDGTALALRVGGYMATTKASGAEQARWLALENGGRYYLVRYTERGCKPVHSWTQPRHR